MFALAYDEMCVDYSMDLEKRKPPPLGRDGGVCFGLLVLSPEQSIQTKNETQVGKSGTNVCGDIPTIQRFLIVPSSATKHSSEYEEADWLPILPKELKSVCGCRNEEHHDGSEPP